MAMDSTCQTAPASRGGDYAMLYDELFSKSLLLEFIDQASELGRNGIAVGVSQSDCLGDVREIFFVCHIINLKDFSVNCKKNFQLFSCTILLCFAWRGRILFFRLCGWLFGMMIVFLTLTFITITLTDIDENTTTKTS
jgi:hypothetical protein